MKVLYTDSNNNLIVLIPTQEGINKLGLKGIIKKDVPEDAINITIVSDRVIPKDRYFRSAWKSCRKKGLDICIKKARGVHLENLRYIRDKKLEELDKETIRYISDTEKAQCIEKDKKVLRDLTEKIISVTSKIKDLDELRFYIPKELK